MLQLFSTLFNIERNAIRHQPMINIQDRSEIRLKVCKRTTSRSRAEKRNSGGRTMLWTIIAVLVVLWLLGLITHVGGGLIHALLVIAAIVLIYNLVTGRRA